MTNRSHAMVVTLAVAVVASAWSDAAADVVSRPPRPQLVLSTVEVASSSAPPGDVAAVRAQVEATLRGNGDLQLCLAHARVSRRAQLVVTLSFDRSREPEVRLVGAVSRAVRRCVQTAAEAVWLRRAPEGAAVVRARYDAQLVYPGHGGRHPLR